ncbi:hypothetical protein [Streptomyces sp. NPDC048386]|uniref:hypothetical protein n=1 Tax=Streptomyces sp. NPDC048386 TaxID=3365541 RepID=UPI003713D912
MTEPFERLDEAMNRRRLELRLKWIGVAQAAGVSYTALNAIRKGTYRPAELTAYAIDEALRWKAGSVYAILDGGSPEPVGEGEGEAGRVVQAPGGTAALSPGEALRRVVRASALELGVSAEGVDEVLQLVRRDLETGAVDGDRVQSGERRDASSSRVDLSELLRTRRLELGLSLEDVAARTVSSASGERVVEADWLDRLERAVLASDEAPEYPQLDALIEVLSLDPSVVDEAAGMQFANVFTAFSDDGETRLLAVGEMSPEDRVKAAELMRLYSTVRHRDGQKNP